MFPLVVTIGEPTEVSFDEIVRYSFPASSVLRYELERIPNSLSQSDVVKSSMVPRSCFLQVGQRTFSKTISCCSLDLTPEPAKRTLRNAWRPSRILVLSKRNAGKDIPNINYNDAQGHPLMSEDSEVFISKTNSFTTKDG